MKSKLILKVTSLLLISTAFMNTYTFASTNDSSTQSTSIEQQLFLDSLPQEQADLLSSTDNEVVNENFSFSKMVIKETSKNKRGLLDENDYEFESATLQDFLFSKNSVKNPRVQLAPGIWVEDDFDNPVVMHGIFVERYSDNNRLFSARSSFTWSRRPYVNATDAVGINCSPAMLTRKDTAKTYGVAFIDMPDGSGGINTYQENILSGKVEGNDITGLGVAITVKPLGSATINTGYIQCDVSFPNTQEEEGVIASQYLSTTLKFGSLSVDATGLPSLGIVLGEDRFSTSVNVTKYN